MTETILELKNRIQTGESFYEKVKKIEGSELRTRFKELVAEYKSLNVRLNYFD